MPDKGFILSGRSREIRLGPIIEGSTEASAANKSCPVFEDLGSEPDNENLCVYNASTTALLGTSGRCANILSGKINQ